MPGRAAGTAALVFRHRVRMIDRLASVLISVSGVAIIGAVLGIGVFLTVEIVPLFKGARLTPGLVQSVLPPDQAAHLVVVDEYQEHAAVLGSDPVIQIVSLSAGQPPALIPLAGLEQQRIRAVSSFSRDAHIAIATDQGVVWIGAIQWQTVFENGQRTTRAVIEPDMMLDAVPGYPITQLAYRDLGARGLLASVADETHLIVTRVATQRPLIGPVRRAQESVAVPLEGLGRPTSVLLNETGTQLLVGTTTGAVTRWRLPAVGAAELIESVPAVSHGSVTVITYLLGDRSVAVGGDDGTLATWSLVRDETISDGWHLTRIHPFPRHATAMAAIAPSHRDKGFIAVSKDGTARLYYMTSERVLGAFSIGAAPLAMAFAPKANGALLVDHAGRLHHQFIDNPHPEVSWRALFGKLWYEGYSQPDYIWQSTGGTDDFEPKFSLVPLIFGTLKGTCYALLFAVPLGIFGALYCSQFLEKRLRNPIKSTIELMAALPSVVLGFVAGVVLAPFVQAHIVAILLLPVIVPVVALCGVWLAWLVPVPAVQAVVRRHEFWLLIAAVAAGLLVTVWLGPSVERGFFGGHFHSWLLEKTGTRYDQRNSLVVGWVMGFAVIPIIFTICEDAFSAVPKHLVSASLACGASAWQTAWRVVLPAAGSGVFSAVMIGFGRAVGETMIVLMATGNTSIMDWSVFNGFRALSANIAVEIPEAPYGGTLYRVLFVAALLLFAMTFVVNTAAELIRLRLRRQLHGL